MTAREDKEKVTMSFFEKASERIIAGLETKRVLSKVERKTVAYHEAGHAIVGWFLKYCSPVVKITIIPRSKGALGFTQYIPEDNQLISKEQIIDSICMTLGGRMAEEVFFNKITTGAADDLQKVTKMAKAIVTEYGMSSLGYRVFSTSKDSFNKTYSEEMDMKIDNEVQKIINECTEKTREIVNKYKNEIEKISEELLKKDTIDILDIIQLIGERPFKMPPSIHAYIEETKERKKRLEEELKLKDEEELAKSTSSTNEIKVEESNLKEEIEKEKNTKI